MESMPEPVKAHVREPLGAQAAVFALLIDDDATVRQTQVEWLTAHALPALAQETRKAFPVVRQLAPERRLPLVEMALPALRQMSPAQFHEFLKIVDALVQADQQISLFEFALQRLLRQHLATHFGLEKPPAVRYTTPDPLVQPTALVLSLLARVGQQAPDDVRAYEAGTKALGWDGVTLEMTPASDSGLKELESALDELAAAAPPLKKQVLYASAACIGADGHITVEEGELLRAISDSLGCPMPPLPEAAAPQ
jgi:hypothetical protein